MIECPIQFEPDGHIYFHKETGEVFTSVTTLISMFHEEFDPTGKITERYAAKHNKTVEQVKEEWRIINEESTIYGSAIHDNIEQFILGNEIPNKQYQWAVDEFSKLKFSGKLFPEKLVYNLEYGICGTADLVELLPNNTFSLADWKTNKKLEWKSNFGNRMLYCCKHLHDVNMVHYEIQLSCYIYMIEQFDLKFSGDAKIHWFNRETRKIESHNIKYQKDLVIQMFKQYKKWKSKTNGKTL